MARRIRTGTSPAGVVAAFGTLWVAEPQDNTAVRVDPRTNRIVKRIALRGGSWTAASDNAVWITQSDGQSRASTPRRTR